MDLHDLAEKLVDRGRRGKTLTMKDYEYVVDESVQPGGVIASGGVGESVTEGSDELYGLRVGDTVKAVINGKRVQGDVIDIFPDSMEVELLLRGPNSGKTVTVDVRDTEALNEQGVSEGKKVDRMVKHIEKSEKKLGHSKKEAEDIAWATVNKRGYLDNANKKKKAK